MTIPGVFSKMIPGDDKVFEDYKITEDGFVISYKNKVPKLLKFQEDRDGYYRVDLHFNHTHKKYMVHRLVALQYVPNPENKPQVNHINGNKKDNRACNLEWVTGSENAKHAVNKNLYNNRVKKVNQYDLDGNFMKQWNSIREAKTKLDLKNAHISQVCQGQRKTAGGFIWKYASNKTKLTKEQVLEIRENKDNLNREQLAKKYKVSCSCIQHIKRGRTWKDVMPGEPGDRF